MFRCAAMLERYLWPNFGKYYSRELLLNFHPPKRENYSLNRPDFHHKENIFVFWFFLKFSLGLVKMISIWTKKLLLILQIGVGHRMNFFSWFIDDMSQFRLEKCHCVSIVNSRCWEWVFWITTLANILWTSMWSANTEFCNSKFFTRKIIREITQNAIKITRKTQYVTVNPTFYPSNTN